MLEWRLIGVDIEIWFERDIASIMTHLIWLNAASAVKKANEDYANYNLFPTKEACI